MIFNKNNEPIIAAGMTAKQLVEALNTDEASDAIRSLNYFDGQQKDELEKVLNDHAFGVRDWRTKMRPRTRNITKMIVEKSGMLFKDADPQLDIYPKNSTNPNEAETAFLSEQLARMEFGEFMHNFDQVVRLLKTGLVLVQWDKEDDQLTFDILHRGNCEVVINASTRRMVALIHRTGSDGENTMYTVWTNDQVVDVVETSKSVTVGITQPNPFGMIPVAQFYDTQTPRSGFWVEQDQSLVDLNELYNLHLTDSEYAIKWAKKSTLFTNMLPANATKSNIAAETFAPGSLRGGGASFDAANELAAKAGPDQVVLLDSAAVDSPLLEYKNPNVDLKPLNEVVDTWVQAFAADWSVKVENNGDGRARANSGFQLIVEEMDNLDLRKQRQRMFEQGFKRLYKVIARVLNTVNGYSVLNEESELFVKFPEIKLPVDAVQQETLWDMRITANRATEIDYFMKEMGMTEQEANDKWLEVVKFNMKKQVLVGTTQPTPPVDPASQSPLTPAGNQPNTNQ